MLFLSAITQNHLPKPVPFPFTFFPLLEFIQAACSLHSPSPLTPSPPHHHHHLHIPLGPPCPICRLSPDKQTDKTGGQNTCHAMPCHARIKYPQRSFYFIFSQPYGYVKRTRHVPCPFIIALYRCGCIRSKHTTTRYERGLGFCAPSIPIPISPTKNNSNVNILQRMCGVERRVGSM